MWCGEGKMNKMFEGYLLLNWKDGKMRIASSRRKLKSGMSEVAIKINVNVELPESIMPVVSGKIIVPSVKAKEVLLSEM